MEKSIIFALFQYYYYLLPSVSHKKPVENRTMSIVYIVEMVDIKTNMPLF